MKDKTADVNKFFLKNLPTFIGYVNSRQVLPMILLLTGGSIFTLLPHILGLLAFFIVYAVAYKLAVDVLIETANGNMSPGDYQISVESKDILIKFLIVGLLQTGVLIWLKHFVNDPLLIIVYLIISTFITPAIFMILSITSSITEALNPITITRLIKSWLATYLGFVCFWLVLEFIQTYGIESLTAKMPGIFGQIIAQFCKFFILILNFHIMGFLIYQNRKSIGFEATSDFEIENTDTIHFEQIKVNPIYERIRSLLAKGDLAQAQEIITDMKKEGDDSDELRDLEHFVFASNNGEDIKPLSVSKKIHELISQDKLGLAFKLYKQLMLDGNKYIEEAPSDISSLATYAYATGKYQLVHKLLKFFHNKYPQNDDIVSNYFLIVQILYKNDQTKEQATSMLRKLIRKFPQHKMIPQLNSWLKGIELMKNSTTMD